MAEAKEYIVTIKSESGQSTSVNGVQETAKGSDDVQKAVKTCVSGSPSAEKATLARNALIAKSVQIAVSNIKSVGMYHVGKYFNLAEDYLSETTYNNVSTAVGKVASFATTVASGAISGSVIPGYGTVVGAAVAAVGWTVNEVVNAYKTMDQQKINFNTVNYQTGFYQTRLGLTDGRAGTNQ